MFFGLTEKLFGNGKQSKSLAKSRLHFVLVQDRTGLTNDELVNFKKELIDVIARYFVIDERGFDIDYKRESEMTTLLINSPVVVRRQEMPSHQVGSKLRGAKVDRAKEGAESEKPAANAQEA